VKEGEYGRSTMCSFMYEKGTMRPVETIVRSGEEE
jgi:hypothetical protein